MSGKTNLRDRLDCAEALWDYGIADDCWDRARTHIHASDADMVINAYVRNPDGTWTDHFLFGEAARGDDWKAHKTIGQLRTLERLSCLPNSTVVCWAGDNRDWTIRDAGLYVGGSYIPHRAWGKDELLDYFRDWFLRTGR